MLKHILDFITCLLAVYGALSIILDFLCARGVRNLRAGNHEIRLVLLVKNAEEVIEGVVRSILYGGFLRRTTSDGKLTVVDMGSTDKTADILRRLENEYGCIDAIGEEEKEGIYSGFSQRQK